MRKVFCVLAVLLALCCQSAFAETVRLSNGTNASDGTSIRYSINQSRYESGQASAFKAKSNNDDYPTTSLFCGDLTTGWGTNFTNGIGINFGTLSVTDFYGDTVGGYIQTLYNHVYDSIFQGNGYNDTYVVAFQMALWEIILDGNSGELDRTKGYLRISTPNDAEANTLATSWLNSISDGSWTAEGADMLYELTVYVPIRNGAHNPDISQTLIGVKSEMENKSTTPEPATLAILGFGLLGAGLAARRKRA